MSTSEPNGTQTAGAPSKLRRWWPLIALAVLAVVLIAGELAFQWAITGAVLVWLLPKGQRDGDGEETPPAASEEGE